ncbi:MAG: hypothetical protein SGBAC_003387 [Bacillariaceae sp.]
MMRSGNVKNESLLSFGVPSECLTDVLLNYSSSIFDVSTLQGQAASALSNDGFLLNGESLRAVMDLAPRR